MTFHAIKTYGHERGLSACYRNHRATSHCRHLHGYALKVQLIFAANDLDERGWVIDFGSLKTVKARLDDMFDHRLIIAEDDPLLPMFRELAKEDGCHLRVVPGVGCEAFCQEIGAMVIDWLVNHTTEAKRVWLEEVQVNEHDGNAASLSRGMRGEP